MNASTQVYLRDVAAGHTELVSRNPDGGADGFAFEPSIDAAGDRISYTHVPPRTATDQSPEVFVRDTRAGATELASRADGIDGAAADGEFSETSAITPSGDCVAFDGDFTNLGDGFDSADASAVHMRVLRGQCPVPPASGPGGGGPGGGGGGPGGGGPGGGGPAHAAVLSKLTVAPARFWVSGFRHGTTIRYRLSRAARVTLRFERLVSGHRRGGHCVSGGHGRHCTLTRSAGTVSVHGAAGANRLRFAGTLHGRRLPRGSYRLVATPAGGHARTVRAHVIRAPQVAHHRR
jgi:hypothetical protein